MIITLDAGHTKGVNQGSHKDYFEGTQMFYFSEHLRDALVQRGHTVRLTRKKLSDNPSFDARCKQADGADLFLSLHSDWAGTDNAVLVFDDHNPKYANKQLANNFAYTLAQYWGCKSKVVYRGYDDVWRQAPSAAAKNYFAVLRGSFAKSNMLLELFNHRNSKACQQFMKAQTQRKIAELLAAAIQTHYRLPESLSTAKYRVVSGSYSTQQGAKDRVAELKSKGFDAWILKQ